MIGRPLLIYVADPMCSWCWGFAPVIEALRQRWADRLRFRLLLGGLRSGAEARTVDAAFRRELVHHWQAVAAASGQPFSPDGPPDVGFVYDTEPASRAVIAARVLAPAQEFALFAAIQRAFYLQRRDVTDGAVLADLAVEVGLSREDFEARWRDAATASIAAHDVLAARGMGVRGFPTLQLRHTGRSQPVTHGYCDLASVEQRLEALV